MFRFFAWKRYLLTLTAAVLSALLVRHVVLTAYRVPTGAMQPALKPGDFIFSYRPAYGLKLPFSSRLYFPQMPQRGDVVVFNYPNQPGVNSLKRVIALPGDRIQMTSDRLTLNGRALRYEAVFGEVGDNPNPSMFELKNEIDEGASRVVILQKDAEKRDFGPLIVPPGEVFLMGDNRDTSDDSRYWGTVPVSQVSGQAILIWLSLDWQNKWADGRLPQVRWSRVLSRVH